ncbi:aldo keto reductase [Chlorella sorokiniana]|uniref:Aldo keto reductase n=1 Tax=Chlorella sorokiniana TaxID=3076 RepID=A0A2P6TQ13_CHLSO|nr:aldo keto reductase [Chlorella sorokiniana]|eukprot:PRW56126.1 aldo keto reductase [Chlorella sorokiniana]
MIGAARCFGAAAAQQPWLGHATAACTAAFAARSTAAAPQHFRRHPVGYSGVQDPLGSLTLSSLGVGTYLGGADEATDARVAAAVVASVQEGGFNVIDTAANYRWGAAEVSVGRALSELRAQGLQRSELFVSTKAGYPPEGLLERALARGDISEFDVAGGSHCMHPAFLQLSLNRSLAAMGLGTADLLYLHNPAESQLGQVGRQEFMQRLRSAFEWAERVRAEGQIKAYGIASWSCFRVPPSDRSHLGLQSVVALAEDVGGTDHGFRYIQLPTSAGMPEAWLQPWQELRDGSDSVRLTTAMEAAAELGLGVFASGPLLQAQLLKDSQLAAALAAVPALQRVQGTAPRLLQFARSTPGLLTALVGHKAPEHVQQNCVLSREPPLSGAEFRAAAAALGIAA